MNYVLKSMSLGEILDTATSLMRARFKVLITIMAYGMIPLYMILNFANVCLMPPPPPPTASQQVMMDFLISAIPAYVVLMLSLGILGLVVLPVTEAAIVHAITSEYLGKPATAKECIRIGFKRFLGMFVTRLLKNLFVSLATLACVIPGIYLAYKWSFSREIVVVEEKIAMDSLTRSGHLMTDNFGTAFVLGVILFFVYLFGAVGGAVVPSAAAKIILPALANAVIYGYDVAVTVVFYFSCRCKLENFDLTMLAHAVGTEAPVEVSPVPPAPSDSLPQ